MPYKFVRHHHNIGYWIKRQSRLAFLILAVSLIFGFVTIFVAERVVSMRNLSLNTLAGLQKQKMVAEVKKQYGDQWKEKLIQQYKEKYGENWKEHAKADYQNMRQ